MRAAVMHAPRDLRVERVPIPTITDNEILVRIRCCAICNGTDRLQFLGETDRAFPFILGHEASGDVEQVGEAVTGFSAGDRVTFWVKIGCFAEYVAVDTTKIAVGRLSPRTTYEQGAMTQLLCSILRGMESAQIKRGDSVLIVGQGPVGLLALQSAKALGASTVVTCDVHPNRLQLSRELGSDLVVDASREDFAETVLREFGRVSVVFDAFGDDISPSGDTMSRAIRVLETFGRYVLFGLSRRPRCFIPSEVLNKKINIVTTHVSTEKAKELMQKACTLVAEGSVRVDPLISEIIPLEQVEKGILKTINHPDKVIKILVRI